MQPVLDYLQQLDLHPVVDHYAIALLTVAVLIDLVGSLAPTRIWIRYTALLLTILGALAAGAAYGTGDLEAGRIWNALGPDAREILHRHSQLGEYLAIVFGVLALWRILIQAVTFFAGSRMIYLIVAIAAAGTLFYQGHLGGKLVYSYGAGTALMANEPVPKPEAGPEASPTPAAALPTVTVPTPTPAPEASPASAPSAASAAPPNPTASPSPTATPAPAGV
ncbi:MAG TPA: DUF2231 domain-containing protein [Candidatus Binataceae bacterium]